VEYCVVFPVAPLKSSSAEMSNRYFLDAMGTRQRAKAQRDPSVGFSTLAYIISPSFPFPLGRAPLFFDSSGFILFSRPCALTTRNMSTCVWRINMLFPIAGEGRLDLASRGFVEFRS